MSQAAQAVWGCGPDLICNKFPSNERRPGQAPCPDSSAPVNTSSGASSGNSLNHLYSIQRRKEICWLMHGWHLVYLGCCNGRDIVLTHLTALGIFLTFPHFLRPELGEKLSVRKSWSEYKFKYLSSWQPQSVSVNLTRTLRFGNVWVTRGEGSISVETLRMITG